MILLRIKNDFLICFLNRCVQNPNNFSTFAIQNQQIRMNEFKTFLNQQNYNDLDLGIEKFLDENNYDGYQFPIEWDGDIYTCLVLKDNKRVIQITKIKNEQFITY